MAFIASSVSCAAFPPSVVNLTAPEANSSVDFAFSVFCEIETLICDIVCLDMEGNLYNSMRFCLAIANLVIVPCRPSRDDLIGLAWVKKLSEAAFSEHPDSNARVVALMNGIEPGSDVFFHIKQQITNDGMEVFNNFLSQSVEIAESNINRVSVISLLGESSREMLKIGQEIELFLKR